MHEENAPVLDNTGIYNRNLMSDDSDSTVVHSRLRKTRGSAASDGAERDLEHKMRNAMFSFGAKIQQDVWS